MKAGAQLITEERARQIEAEGFGPEHDANHGRGELASAAVCYALLHANYPIRDGWKMVGCFWPWDDEYWKPRTPVENLVRAGALIAAEIDRLHLVRARSTLAPPPRDLGMGKPG